jgi:sirohydrochlorin ferrochelatase
VTSLLQTGIRRVSVATYLLAPGFFADRIRDSSLAAGAAAVSPVLGASPEVADVVVHRYVQRSPKDATTESEHPRARILGVSPIRRTRP